MTVDGLLIAGTNRLTAYGSSCNAANVLTLDTKVLQFTGCHTAKLVDGLAILAPSGKTTCYIHGVFLSENR